MKNKVKKDAKTKNSELTEVMAKLNSTKEAEYHQFHQVDGGVHCVARCSTARCNSLDMRRLCTVASLGTPASSAARASWTRAKWRGTWCCAPRRKVKRFNLPTSPECNYNTSPSGTCKQNFASKALLGMHMKRFHWTLVQAFPCPVCCVKLAKRKGVAQHMSPVHMKILIINNVWKIYICYDNRVGWQIISIQ